MATEDTVSASSTSDTSTSIALAEPGSKNCAGTRAHLPVNNLLLLPVSGIVVRSSDTSDFQPWIASGIASLCIEIDSQLIVKSLKQ